MTPEKPPPGTIPTLTEVVSWPDAPAPVASSQAPLPAATPQVDAPVQAPAAVTEAQLTRRVMAELQKQIDLMLEVRVREALAPILSRAGDAIVRDARRELTAALHDVVARAVARELDRADKS